MKEDKKNRSILNSMLAKIIAFFMLTFSLVAGIVGTLVCFYLWESDVYTRGIESLIKDIMRSQVVWNDVNYIKALYMEGDTEGINNYLMSRNLEIEMLDNTFDKNIEDGMVLYSNYGGMKTQYFFNCYTDIAVVHKVVPEVPGKYTELDEETDEETDLEIDEEADVETILVLDASIEDETEYVTEFRDILIRMYVDESFSCHDEYKAIHDFGMTLEKWIYVIPVLTVISILLCLGCFIFLMCSAGHHRDREGISGGVLYFFHLDFLTVAFGAVALLGLIFSVEFISSVSFMEGLLGVALLAAVVIWCTIYCMDLAVELKLGTVFKHTLLYMFLRLCVRNGRRVWNSFVSTLRGFPLVANVMIVYIGYALVQFIVLLFFCILWRMDLYVLVLCVLEKTLLFPAVLYFALMCKQLQKGSEALAEGNLSYELDTSKMLFGFREHGENLNRIGEGIAVAVEERMKSEHLKTELITNVSHDLKTPLTSIINYADLLGTAVAGQGMEQIEEYSEVLLRQSKRLKKLLEDLVEASKATTGNLEVNLTSCEISVILSQAIGEYSQRFESKQLELIVKQPEEPVNIQADGRHLWRVLDNLMNNICKYAQEGTRVYLTVENKEQNAQIVFRNMSKYPLDISGEELQERFVRGDKSRHMEGNGLGLSIAGSLMELQGGRMEIVTDGDLFKVILHFPLSEK